MGIASLILGIISLIIGFVPLCGSIALLPAIIGVILGIIDISKKSKTGEKKSQSIAGLIMSAIAVVIIIFWIFVASGVEVETDSNFTNEYLENKQIQEEQKQNEQTTQPKEEIKQEERKDYMEVDYEVLYQDYQDNAINADAKYRGKVLKLTGKIHDINREISGNPYITFRVGGQYSYKDVRITLKKSEEAKVTKLSKGQTVTIKGKCTGQLVTGTVSLNDSEIIE